MPDGLASAQAADRRTISAKQVGDHVDLRMPLDGGAAVLLHRREVQVAKPAAKAGQLVIRERLPAEQQHGMIEPGPMDGPEQRVIDPAQVGTADLGAEHRAGGYDVDPCSGGIVGCFDVHQAFPVVKR